MLPIPDHPQGIALTRLLTSECKHVRLQGIELAESLELSATPLVCLVRSLRVTAVGDRLQHLSAALRQDGERAYTNRARADPFFDALERLHWHLTGPASRFPDD